MKPVEPANGIELHAYPRPLLERPEWFSLNGIWDFAIDPEAAWAAPCEVAWNAKILVPFSPETPASGVNDTGWFRACWYRCTFRAPELEGRRLMLHFGAVDYRASVWVNGALAALHQGGYTPFEVDITGLLLDGPQTVVVRAEDDPAELAQPRGKQDWQRNPHGIWYHRTSGIWQTVWLERVPVSSIERLTLTPSIERWEIGLEARIGGPRRDGLRLAVRLGTSGRVLAEDTYSVAAGEVTRRIALGDPGLEDCRSDLLWSPECPRLIDVEVALEDRDGRIIDQARSYAAMRAVSIQGDRFLLNGRPYQLRLVLDQGYWPESGLTAPSDDALRRDVELARAMGFNGVRKHQKIEDPRYLYWADRLGLLVWEEMPSAYRYNSSSVERLTKEWVDAVRRDIGHPSIVAWVPFNESWGVPDLPDSPAQRHYVRALYHLTKALDPSRPVIGNDGWESVAGDILGIHDYDSEPARIGARYAEVDGLPRLLERERPGGRMLLLNTIESDHRHGRPIVLSEFGGLGYCQNTEGAWGYTWCDSAEDFGERFMELLSVVRSLPSLAGFCYTQFTDTYQEVNGLLYADRTPKIPLEDVRLAVLGPSNETERQTEWAWRERLLERRRQQVWLPRDYSR